MQPSVSTDLTYPYKVHPEPGDTHEVIPGVHWLTMPMGGSLNHINLYVLEDHDGWFVVDTGLATNETRQYWEQIFTSKLKKKPVKGVICTHMHPDHIGQAGMITEKFRVPLYMTGAEYYQARSMFAGFTTHASWLSGEFYTRAGMEVNFLEQMNSSWRARMPQDMKAIQKTHSNTPIFPTGFHRIVDGDVFSIGAHDWQVLVGSGHSPEHACLYCKTLKTLISGDQILPIITSNVSVHPSEPDANPLKNWMDSHDRFLDLAPDTFVLPAHNLPFYGVRERLRELINHHEDRMLDVEEHCIEPQAANALLPVLFKRKLDARQTMMALGEAIAHCHLLMHRNRLERNLVDGVYRFTSIDPDLKRRAHPDQHDAPDDSPMLV